jgi:hypothetical protein
MKTKTKDLIHSNAADCTNLYDKIEKLQFKLEALENEHIILLRELQRIQNSLDIT